MCCCSFSKVSPKVRQTVEKKLSALYMRSYRLGNGTSFLFFFCFVLVWGGFVVFVVLGFFVVTLAQLCLLAYYLLLLP